MFEPMNGLSERQLSRVPDIADSNIHTGQNFDQDILNLILSADVFIDGSVNNNHLLNLSEFLSEPVDGSEFTELMLTSNNMTESENKYQNNLKNTSFNQLPSNIPMSAGNFVQTNNLLTPPITIDNAILTQTISHESHQPCKSTSNSKKLKVSQNQSTTVTPVNHLSDPNAHILCNSVLIQSDHSKSMKIKIKSQPRPEYRPRTQNESKNSSHYLRCQLDSTTEHPAIYIPQIWSRQSCVNIIRVTLVGIDKQPHPYTINNKSSKPSFDTNDTLIVKQHEPHVLYFRVTNEDFLSGFKTFMIELVKSKQDHIITKKLIRTRKLDQSMLCFTRIYEDESGKLCEDIANQEYSCIMTENYGDIAVEGMGPRYGPMSGQEIVYITFKNRIVKEDLSITISGQTINWSQEINDITLSGNIIYFPMPAFPCPQMNRAKVNVTIFLKKEKFYESTYLYLNLIDQELNHANLNNSTSGPLIFQKSLKNKSIKRLNSK